MRTDKPEEYEVSEETLTIVYHTYKSGEIVGHIKDSQIYFNAGGTSKKEVKQSLIEDYATVLKLDL